MLIKRILTALIFVPIIVLALFKLSDVYFEVFLGVFILIAAWEWANLSASRIVGKAIFMTVLVLTIAWIMSWTVFLQLMQELTNSMAVYEYSGILDWFVIGPVIWWLLAMILIRNAPDSLLTLKVKPGFLLVLGWFVLFSAWMFLSRLRGLYTPEMAFYFLLLIWSADIAAYFVGKKFGVTKLAPDISPGKTVAGMMGAMGSALVCAIVLSLYYGFSMLVATQFMVLSAFTVLVSIYGDLFVSLLKRKQGVKDSGRLLPGHGGFLDRMDSLIAASPIFYAGVTLIMTQFT